MAIAVVLGVLIASGRVYGRGVVRLALTGYVELMRGTPILLQLFVIYYGLASVIQLPAFVAALVGLALNYAAYESEIYRGALEAISPESTSFISAGRIAATARARWLKMPFTAGPSSPNVRWYSTISNSGS